MNKIFLLLATFIPAALNTPNHASSFASLTMGSKIQTASSDIPPFNEIVAEYFPDYGTKLYAVGTDNHIYYKSKIAKGDWAPWWDINYGFLDNQNRTVNIDDVTQILAGVIVDGPVLFMICNGGKLGRIIPRDAKWDQLYDIYNLDVQQIAFAKPVNADGVTEGYYALGDDGSVYYRRTGAYPTPYEAAPNYGWVSLGGHDIRQVAAARNADGRSEVFALGGDGAVYHIWQTEETNHRGPEYWGDYLHSQWANLQGHDIKQITAAQNQDGRLELFALGGNGAVYHIWQLTANGDWGDWATLQGHDIKQITVAQNADGRLELFALGSDETVYDNRQLTPNGGWGTWLPLAGHDIRQLSVAPDEQGRLQLFALGGDGVVYYRFQVIPNGGWSAWSRP